MKGQNKSVVPLFKAVSVQNNTEGHITGLALPWCVSSLIVHLVTAPTFQPPFCGFFASTSSFADGHRNMLHFPFQGDTCLVHITKSTQQVHQAAPLPCRAPCAECMHLLKKYLKNASTLSCTYELFFCGWSRTESAGQTGQLHPCVCCRP